MDAAKLLGLIIVVTVLSGLWFVVTDNTLAPEPEPAPKKKPARKKATPRKKKK